MEPMDLQNIFIAIFIILLGFLVKGVPILIAGYNTMPQEKKDNVDIDGLSTLIRNGLIIMGLTIIIGNFIFKWMDLSTIADNIIKIVLIPGVIILVILAQKFDHNKRR